MTECVIMRIEKAAIVRVLHDEPEFSEMFMAYLLARNSRVEEDLVDQLFNSSEKRLARVLLLMANFGKEGKPEPVIADHHAARAAIDAIVERHGHLDILIANAGINHRVPLADWTPADWHRILDTNLGACFLLAQQAAVSMRRQKHGRIIFTTSIASILARGGIHAYAASKSGLVGLTRSLACELGDYGITCNGSCPGYFETELTASYLQSEEYVARLNSRVPLRRWGQPRDLAGVAVYLAPMLRPT
jgi:NAD(P)-dependent dehydrogenase (short-subunit alcohol dehydrogenase family)